jgi:folate-binding protein YgfZ
MTLTEMTPTEFSIPGGATLLPQWGVIRAVGDDAASFLHNQLSNDVVKQTAQQARLAAYCTAQGRMLASFVVVKPTADEVWLACSADLLQATLKRLSMFVLRAKARLTDASGELAVVGLAGPSVRAWLGDVVNDTPWSVVALEGAADRAQVVRLPDAAGTPRWLWLGPAAQADALLAALPAIDESLWRWLEVRAGVAPVVAATSGQFVPQMLNYELVGGVDFRKGCYPGQEIVARSQYLGKLKRRGFLVDGPATLQAGQDVFWSGDDAQPAGVVALAAPHPGGGASALVELKLMASQGGSLHLGAPQGPALTLRPLPYALPHEVETGSGAA